MNIPNGWWCLLVVVVVVYRFHFFRWSSSLVTCVVFVWNFLFYFKKNEIKFLNPIFIILFLLKNFFKTGSFKILNLKSKNENWSKIKFVCLVAKFFFCCLFRLVLDHWIQNESRETFSFHNCETRELFFLVEYLANSVNRSVIKFFLFFAEKKDYKKF